MSTLKIDATITGMPDGQATKFCVALRELVGRYGNADTSLELHPVLIDPQLESLRLGPAITNLLIGHGITNLERLTAQTEADLLDIAGIGYGRLRVIKRALASTQSTLAGEPVTDPADRLEAMRSPLFIYEELKQAGFHAISELKTLDLYEIGRRIHSEPLTWAGPLLKLDVTFAPPPPERTFEQLIFLGDDKLRKAGIYTPAQLITYTATGLEHKLIKADMSDAAYTVKKAQHELKRLGLSLRSEEESSST